MKRVAFLSTRPDLASRKIRGDQIAQRIGAVSLPYSFEEATKYDFLIYIKYPPSVEDLRRLGKQGAIQVLDVLDNYNLGMIGKRREFLDGFIAASLLHKIFLEARLEAPIEYIPHHHCNVRERRIEVRDASDLVIGYVGDKVHWRENAFVGKHFENLFADFTFEDIEGSYLKIDVGFAYRRNLEKARFNAHLKLLNFMSFGIPAVLTPEVSYTEIGNHGQHCMYAQTEEDFVGCISYLLHDYPMRKRMADLGYEKAKRYHIARICEEYKRFVEWLPGVIS